MTRSSDTVTIWRVATSATAQRVRLASQQSVFTRFDGVQKWPSLDDPVVVRGELAQTARSDWIFLEPGVLVVRCSLFDENDAIPYVFLQDVETFGIRASEGLEAIHPLHTLARGTRGPCLLYGTYRRAVFRIQGQSPFELFTTVGFECHPNDDLKTICEQYRLTGLEFEEFWRGPLEDLV